MRQNCVEEQIWGRDNFEQFWQNWRPQWAEWPPSSVNNKTFEKTRMLLEQRSTLVKKLHHFLWREENLAEEQLSNNQACMADWPDWNRSSVKGMWQPFWCLPKDTLSTLIELFVWMKPGTTHNLDNTIPKVKHGVAASAVGMFFFFSSRNWETSQYWGKDECSKVQRHLWWKSAPELSDFFTYNQKLYLGFSIIWSLKAIFDTVFKHFKYKIHLIWSLFLFFWSSKIQMTKYLKLIQYVF